MSDEAKGIQEQVAERAVDVRNELITQSANAFLMARRALLASLGVVACSLEEGNQFIDKLVERGEVAESDIYKMLNDLRSSGQAGEEKASESRKSMAAKASMALEDSVEQILNRFNVPTRGDIEALSSKITQLTERIQTLKKQNGG